VLNLTAIRITQADDAPNIAAVNEGDVVEPVTLGHETDHSQFVELSLVLATELVWDEALVWVDERYAYVLRAVELVFGRVELEAHVLM
jgi:hypothetical protein